MPATVKEIGIREEIGVAQEALRVDRSGARPVVRGVKIVGLTSKNRREYPAQTLKEALPLYEGAKINDDHPRGSATSARTYGERMGNVLKGSVNFREGHGIYGDVSINPKHALAEQFLDDAEHAPENVALSHNILGRITYRGDIAVVEKITRVISVDVVGDPGSTNGLFESEDFDAMKTVKKTLRVLLAEARPSMVAAFEPICVANGFALESAYDVQEGVAADQQLIAALESLSLAQMRESSNTKRFENLRVLGMLQDDVRANAAPLAEKYKSAGSSVAGGGAGNADTAPLAGVSEGLGKQLLEGLTAIGNRLGAVEGRFATMDANAQKLTWAKEALRESAVAETPALLESLAALPGKAEMKLQLITGHSGLQTGGPLLERNNGGGGDWKPAENAKGLAGRLVS